MWFYVYVLSSIHFSNRLYIGYTANLERRVEEHNKGKSASTKPYVPWELIYFEGHKNKGGAKARERYFKTHKGRRSLKLIINK